MLRQHAFGNFGLMVKAISRDPAMLIWLDTRESKNDHPNENFAREVMELFTLGIGNYTENDVQQAARAFTGYRIESAGRDIPVRAAPARRRGRRHSSGRPGRSPAMTSSTSSSSSRRARNSSRGNSGPFSRTRTRAGPGAGAGGEFPRNNYEIRPLMNAIFRSAEFYSPDCDPHADQVAGAMAGADEQGARDRTGADRMVTVNALRQLGQVPFAPPNVKGWDGGRAWITTSTLLYRYNLANFRGGQRRRCRCERLRRAGRIRTRPPPATASRCRISRRRT